MHAVLLESTSRVLHCIYPEKSFTMTANTTLRVATNRGNRWFFVYGFEKNDRANIADDELEALKDIAEQLLARTGRQLDEAVQDGSLQEICHDHKI